MCARCGGVVDTDVQSGFPSVCEEDLPLCVRDVLFASRTSRPDRVVTCIAFRTIDGSQDSLRVGPSTRLVHACSAGTDADRLRPKELLVLSVTVTETTFESVRKITHVLVARIRPDAGRHHAA